MSIGEVVMAAMSFIDCVSRLAVTPTKGVGVVKTLRLSGRGPVVLIHTQEFRFLKKNKRPTSVVERYKATYGHKAVVLMSVVEGRAEHLLASSFSGFDCHNGHRVRFVGMA